MFNSKLIFKSSSNLYSILLKYNYSRISRFNKNDLVENEKTSNELMIDNQKYEESKNKLDFSILKKDLRNDYEIKKMKRFYNDDIVLDVENSFSLLSFLKVIDKNCKYLKPHHIETIYGKLFDLTLESIKKKDFNDFKIYLVNQKSFFDLNKQTLKLIRELEPQALISILKSLVILKLDLKTKISISSFQLLKEQVNDLNLDQILECFQLIYYSRKIRDPNIPFYDTFNTALKIISEIKILNNEFDEDNLDLIINYLNLFSLNYKKDQVMNKLISCLKGEKNFSFSQSVKILSFIKNLNHTDIDKDFLNFLINKCNSIIYEMFLLKPTKFSFFFYTKNLHPPKEIVLNKNFRNIYDYKLLSALTQLPNGSEELFLTKDYHNLIHNFLNNKVYNEDLFKKFYENILKNEEFRNSLNCVKVFLSFTKFKFDFVDYNKLTKLIFTVENLNKTKIQEDIAFFVLSKLILLEIDDENIINYFLNLTKNFNVSNLKGKNIFYLNYLNAKSFLPFFNINTETKNKVSNYYETLFKFKEPSKVFLNFLSERKEKNFYCLNYFWFKKVLLNAFVVYNKDEQKLVNLNKIDNLLQGTIKLAPNEEFHALNFIFKLQGSDNNFKLISNKSIDFLCKEYNIKSIDIFKEDLIEDKIIDEIKKKYENDTN